VSGLQRVLKKSSSTQRAPSGAEARIDSEQFMYELKLVPFKAKTFSAASSALKFLLPNNPGLRPGLVCVGPLALNAAGSERRWP
jgi:hypothetical protein